MSTQTGYVDFSRTPDDSTHNWIISADFWEKHFGKHKTDNMLSLRNFLLPKDIKNRHGTFSNPIIRKNTFMKGLIWRQI